MSDARRKISESIAALLNTADPILGLKPVTPKTQQAEVPPAEQAPAKSVAPSALDTLPWAQYVGRTFAPSDPNKAPPPQAAAASGPFPPSGPPRVIAQAQRQAPSPQQMMQAGQFSIATPQGHYVLGAGGLGSLDPVGFIPNSGPMSGKLIRTPPGNFTHDELTQFTGQRQPQMPPQAMASAAAQLAPKGVPLSAIAAQIGQPQPPQLPQMAAGGPQLPGRLAARRQELMSNGMSAAEAMQQMASEGSIDPRLAQMLIAGPGRVAIQ